MYIPLVKRIRYRNDVLVERSLPEKGLINVNSREEVEAFTQIGISKHIPFTDTLPAGFRPSKKYLDKPEELFAPREVVGTLGIKPVKAPFSGHLLKVTQEKSDAKVVSETYKFISEKESYVLFSGVWGKVKDVYEDRSVLISTQATDIAFLACTNESAEGELVVFPNPDEILQMQYLQKFFKNIQGKVVYVGNALPMELAQKAVDLGIVALLAGGASREVFNFCKMHNIFLGVFSGFGDHDTPEEVFEVLNSVSNRFVFCNSYKRLLRIPMPERFNSSQIRTSNPKMTLRRLKKGLRVLVLDEAHFGQSGVVEKYSESSIVVKLDKNEELIEVYLSNILALY